jgi:hypothetical protein
MLQIPTQTDDARREMVYFFVADKLGQAGARH